MEQDHLLPVMTMYVCGTWAASIYLWIMDVGFMLYSSCQMEQVHLLPVVKSTKVQNPRRKPRYYANARERKLGTPRMYCGRCAATAGCVLG